MNGTENTGIGPELSDILPGGEPLLARVRVEASAAGVSRIRLALGYLFVPGLAPVWDALDRSSAAELHLLIGNTAGTLTEEQQVALADEVSVTAGPNDTRSPEMDVAAAPRTERARIVTETAQALRENLAHIPAGDAAAQGLLLRLARAANTGRLRVRIYPDGRLHAKAYLFERQDEYPTVALVGSSNLSLPSPGNPTELNVVVRDRGATDQLTVWFDTLWDAGQDFSRELLTEILNAPCLQPAA
jgi:phosphatidylserine/phosphatidylglycerophosphate/cardiolipin synthase-like enzyme